MKTFRSFISESMTTDKTLAFIKKAHDGQFYGSKPYWTHPKAVADAGKKIFGSRFNQTAYLASLLHDVIEDTPYTEADLKQMGFSSDVLAAVKLVTKDKSLTYAGNIEKIIKSGNKTAMMVKYADNYINFTGDKSSWKPEKRAASQAKYKKSIQTIGKTLGVTSPELTESMANRYMLSLNMLGEALGIKSDWTLADSQLHG